MLLTIQNDKLELQVDTLGAQMMSIRSEDGTQYLWQGGPKYWGDRAPVLFPFIARLTNDSYRYLGETYHMGIHGFAAQSELFPLYRNRPGWHWPSVQHLQPSASIPSSLACRSPTV